MLKNWPTYLKAIMAFAGSLATAIVTVGLAKHGEPWTNFDWLTVIAMVAGVGGTTAGVYHAKNQPEQDGD